MGIPQDETRYRSATFYQEDITQFCVYPGGPQEKDPRRADVIYPLLGLVDEGLEAADKILKAFVDSPLNLGGQGSVWDEEELEGMPGEPITASAMVRGLLEALVGFGPIAGALKKALRGDRGIDPMKFAEDLRRQGEAVAARARSIESVAARRARAEGPAEIPVRSPGIGMNEMLLDSDREEIGQELGDVAFYLAATAGSLGITLGQLLTLNFDKLQGRFARGVLRGDGDNR